MIITNQHNHTSPSVTWFSDTAMFFRHSECAVVGSDAISDWRPSGQSVSSR